jgi:RimJ/RimL family protein N-acetyltransferase
MRLERESPAVSDDSLADWRQGLPVLRGDRVLLREPVLSDAPFLFRELCVPEVCEYVPPPPPEVDGIERMIAKGIERRQAGQAFSFAIQLADSGELAGILQFVSSRDHLSDAAIPG